MLPSSSMRTPSRVSAGRSRSGSSLAASDADFLGLVAVAGERLFVRLEDHQALVAVDDHQIAAGDFGQERSGAHNGRNFQGLGHDGRVAARPADLGHKAADEAAIEVGRFAGRKVVGQHQHRRGEVGDPFAAAAQQVPEQTLFDVEDVVGPLRQIGAFQPLEDLGVAAQRAADGVLGRVVPLADHLLQLAAEPRVLEHLQVGLEDRAVFLAQLGGDRLAMVGDFGGRGGDGLVEPLHLVDDRVARHEPPRDAKSLVVHHQRLADGHARRDGNPLKFLHQRLRGFLVFVAKPAGKQRLQRAQDGLGVRPDGLQRHGRRLARPPAS